MPSSPFPPPPRGTYLVVFPSFHWDLKLKGSLVIFYLLRIILLLLQDIFTGIAVVPSACPII